MEVDDTMQSKLVEFTLRREIDSYNFTADQFGDVMKGIDAIAGVFEIRVGHGHLHIIFTMSPESPDQIAHCRHDQSFIIELMNQKGVLIDRVIGDILSKVKKGE